MSEVDFWRFFHEIYEALPRQGPGSRESTERALRMLPTLTADQRLLDIGCGSGAQTLDIARATQAQIFAVDRHEPFVVQLRARARSMGLEARVGAEVGDMAALRFPDGSFDVVWSEGAIFILGFARGLAEWRRLLVPGGHLVISEFCWLRDDPPAELREMFLDGGASDAGDLAARRRAIEANGYRLLGDFVLPDVAWWENYYVPLAEVLTRFRAAHADDPEALQVAARCAREIELYRSHPGVYGYVFFIFRRG